MPLPDATTLPPQRERLLLLTLAAIQFTHIMDFMIMMPLGASLMRVFSISPGQFSFLVAAYGISAAVAGFLGGLYWIVLTAAPPCSPSTLDLESPPYFVPWLPIIIFYFWPGWPRGPLAESRVRW